MLTLNKHNLLAGMACIFWSLVVATMAIGLPLAVKSAYRQIVASTTRQYVYTLIAPGNASEQLHLLLAFHDIDAVNNTMTLVATGYRTCRRGCRYHDSLLLSSFSVATQSAPRTTKLALPTDSTLFTEQVTLPIQGSVRYYPFGQYTLNVGIAIERQYEQDTYYLRVDKNPGALSLKMDDDMSGMKFSRPPGLLNVDKVAPTALLYPYLAAVHASFNRPFYMKFFLVLIVALFAVATLYTLINTTFDKIIINTGSIIFGLWATRTIVLAGLPPYVTFMDLALGLLMAGVFLSLAVHASLHYYRRCRKTSRKRADPLV